MTDSMNEMHVHGEGCIFSKTVLPGVQEKKPEAYDSDWDRDPVRYLSVFSIYCG